MAKITAFILAILSLLYAFCDNLFKVPAAPQPPESTVITTTVPEPGFDNSEIKAPFTFSQVEEYSGEAYTVVNNGIPYFKATEITTSEFETYSDLDELGRCGTAYANICKNLMPTEEREEISSVKPSGWTYNGKSNNNKYEFIDGKYIYNRCHLIGFQLAGENANNKNLITGTRYLNIDGMLLFENMVADYVKETNNHVLYRVTPIYKGNELVPRGVLIEAYSVEDKGNGIEFCVFSYNIQPGIEINYLTGQNWLIVTEDTASSGYIINTKTKKIHTPDCEYATSSSQSFVNGNINNLINEGYVKCKVCNPV